VWDGDSWYYLLYQKFGICSEPTVWDGDQSDPEDGAHDTGSSEPTVWDGDL